MAYKKKTSTDIEKARRRIAGVESVANNLDLGNGLNTAAYKESITSAEQALNNYNNLLSQADGALTQFMKLEKDLADFSERILAGIGSKFGFDSVEYEKAGGTRKSEKRKPNRKMTSA